MGSDALTHSKQGCMVPHSTVQATSTMHHSTICHTGTHDHGHHRKECIHDSHSYQDSSMEGCIHDDGGVQITSTGHEGTTSSHTRCYMYPWNDPGLYMGSGHEDSDAHGMLLRSDSTIILVLPLCTTVDDISGLGISHVIRYYLTTSCEFSDDVIVTCPKSRVTVYQRWEQLFDKNHNRLTALSVDARELTQVDVLTLSRTVALLAEKLSA